MAGQRERLVALLEPVVISAELDLEDLRVRRSGKRNFVQIVVDGEGGVPLDLVAEVSRGIAEVLDSSDVMGEFPYILEVTSPGVDRPLRDPRHWRRAVGRLVEAHLTSDEEVLGRVLRSDLESATLDVDGVERRIVLAEVSKAHVQIEFGRPGDALDQAEDELDDTDEDGEEN